jgi:hypothetical protein
MPAQLLWTIKHFVVAAGFGRVSDDRREQTRLDDIEDVDDPAVGDESVSEETEETATERSETTEDADRSAAPDGDRPADSAGETGLGAVDGADAGRPRRVSSTGDVEETVELGVALLATLEGELPLSATIDRIETITTDPALTREILDTAQLRGLIEREDGLVRVRSGRSLDLERDVVRREGEFTCRRCGCSLSTGHFIRFETAEHGPFGSSCIRKVTGRE